MKSKNTLFFVIALVVLLLAILSRFSYLAVRPLHHDEGMLAYFAWKLSDFGDYIYTPQIHGPILFYIEALIFKIFRAGDYAARAGSALFGVALILSPLLFAKQIGKRRAIVLSILFLTSPLLLYFSRFLVHTSIVVVFWLLLILSLRAFFVRPSPVPFYLSVIWLALAFGTSETTYIFLAVLIGFVGAAFFLSPFAPYFDSLKRALKNAGLYIKGNPLDLVAGVLLFVSIWIVIYSVGFTNYKSLVISLPNPFNYDTGLGFWVAQHPKRLGGQPLHYYLMLMVVYEPLILVGAIGGLIESLRRRNAFYLFLAYLAVAVLILFSLAGEKFPWLALCPLLPITVLAGFYYADKWKQFSSGVKAIVILLLAFTLLNAVRLNFLHPADTNELAVYVQTPDKFQTDVAGPIARDCDNRGADCVLIDQQITWPLSWTFKSSSSLFYAESLEVKDTTQYIFVAPENSDKTTIPEGWQKRTVTLRDWWVPDKCNLIKNPQCYGRFISYFLLRKTWNDKGGYDVYLYHKF